MGEATPNIEIRFEGLTVAEAGIKAKNLLPELLASARDVKATIRKDDPTTQDFGSTLVLVLGTPAVIAVARGIAAYLKKDRATISISSDGEVLATGVSGDDAVRIAETFSRKLEK